MTDYTGWKIIKDDDDGSLLVESPTGSRRRIWQGPVEHTDDFRQAMLNPQPQRATPRQVVAGDDESV